MNARHPLAGVPAAGVLLAHGVGVGIHGKSLLQACSAQFAAGQVTAILGPNGAGKSTFMSVLTGQRPPGEGHVSLDGRGLAQCSAEDLARQRAFVAQETQIAFDFTVREVVELGRYPHRRRPSADEAGIAENAMAATAVDHLADRPLNTLSGGEKARAHLARALAQVWESAGAPAGPSGAGGERARWLLLDEPTAALDLQHQHRMLALARDWADAQGVGVIAVLHDLNLALRYSDRCVVLQGGEVVDAGPTADVLTADCIRCVWNVAAHPVLLPGASGLGAVQYLFEALV